MKSEPRGAKRIATFGLENRPFAHLALRGRWHNNVSALDLAGSLCATGHSDLIDTTADDFFDPPPASVTRILHGAGFEAEPYTAYIYPLVWAWAMVPDLYRPAIRARWAPVALHRVLFGLLLILMSISG